MDVIKEYGTDGCAACQAAKRYFDGNDIPYVYIDLEQNPEEAEYLMEKTGAMSVPQFEFPDGSFEVGFSPNKITNKVAKLKL